MKKLLTVLCVIMAAALALTACGTPSLSQLAQQASEAAAQAQNNGETQAAQNQVQATAPAQSSTYAPAAVNTTNEVPKGIEVEEVPFNNYMYLLLTNKTGKDTNLRIEVTFFAANGSIVDTSSGSVDSFGNGTTVCAEFYSDGDFDKCVYTIKDNGADDYYVAVDQNLELGVSKADDKIIVSLKNNGKVPAKYVWFYAFLYKDGKLVDVEYSYCEDDDSEIKVGATVTGNAYTYEEYDDLRVFYHGTGYADD